MSILTQFADDLRHALGVYNKRSILGTNFRQFGPGFGIYDFDDYVQFARDFFEEAMNADDKTYYTILEMPGGRIGIDYDGQRRGIYTRHGDPIAFFKPDYQRRGFTSKSEELAEWRREAEAA